MREPGTPPEPISEVRQVNAVHSTSTSDYYTAAPVWCSMPRIHVAQRSCAVLGPTLVLPPINTSAVLFSGSLKHP